MCLGKPQVDTSYQDFQMKEAQAARQRETERQSRIDGGLEKIRGVFDGTMPGVLAEREAQQKAFYLPQLDQQRGKAAEGLTFALSRAGLLNSTVAGEKSADLADQFSSERAALLARIASDISGTRTTLNQSRSSIEAGLRASGDATSATNAALDSAVSFRQDQPQLNSLGDLFLGISQGIGSARQGFQVGQIKRASTPSVYGAGSGRVVM